MASEQEQTRLADELSKVYEILDDAHDEAQTQREEAILGLMYILTDYGRDVALQREFPTPNQKLHAAVADDMEIEDPDDPGFWPDYAGGHDDYSMLIDWTDPDKGEISVDD